MEKLVYNEAIEIIVVSEKDRNITLSQETHN